MQSTIKLDGKNVLVVEDDDMNFIYLNQIFKITKGNVSRAKTGNQALEMVENNTYDLILMDIQLPDINGNEVTRKIRATNAEIPIIAQTAGRTPMDAKASIAAGCNDILTKPFKINDFSRIVSSVLF